MLLEFINGCAYLQSADHWAWVFTIKLWGLVLPCWGIFCPTLCVVIEKYSTFYWSMRRLLVKGYNSLATLLLVFPLFKKNKKIQCYIGAHFALPNPFLRLSKPSFFQFRGQHSSFLVKWLSVPGRKLFLHHFWVAISWLPCTFELINDCEKWLFHEFIHNFWLSLRF